MEWSCRLAKNGFRVGDGVRRRIGGRRTGTAGRGSPWGSRHRGRKVLGHQDHFSLHVLARLNWLLSCEHHSISTQVGVAGIGCRAHGARYRRAGKSSYGGLSRNLLILPIAFAAPNRLNLSPCIPTSFGAPDTSPVSAPSFTRAVLMTRRPLLHSNSNSAASLRIAAHVRTAPHGARARLAALHMSMRAVRCAGTGSLAAGVLFGPTSRTWCELALLQARGPKVPS